MCAPDPSARELLVLVEVKIPHIDFLNDEGCVLCFGVGREAQQAHHTERVTVTVTMSLTDFRGKLRFGTEKDYIF